MESRMPPDVRLPVRNGQVQVLAQVKGQEQAQAQGFHRPEQTFYVLLGG
jgi:hypothetical protein